MNIYIFSLASLFTLEALSFFASLTGLENIFVFSLVVALIAFSYKRLEFLFLFLLIEIFVGGKGYMLYAEIPVLGKIPLRMILFATAIILSLFFHFQGNIFAIKKIFTQKSFRSFAIFGVFIVTGTILGLLRNDAQKVYLDANAWAYFFILPAFLSSGYFKNTEKIFEILSLSVLWTAAKTFITFALFSSGASFVGDAFLYRWIRNSGVGEITNMGENIFRVFFQSHIYSLIALVSLLALLLSHKGFQLKKSIFFGLTLYASILNLLASESRSMWVSAIITAFFMAYFTLRKKSSSFARVAAVGALLFVITLSQVSLLQLVTGGPSIFSLSRNSGIGQDTSGASRKAQLIPLIKKISKHPIIGSGFGTEVTYKSADPRILKKNPKGNYTTYAFEWGYLDMVLKIGIIGLFAYLAFFFSLIRGALALKLYFLAFGLVALGITHIFTPYLNHPLGIVFVLLAICFVSPLKTQNDRPSV